MKAEGKGESKWFRKDGVPKRSKQQLSDVEREALIKAGYRADIERSERKLQIHVDFPWMEKPPLDPQMRDKDDDEQYPTNK